jgi:hypothetical protein
MRTDFDYLEITVIVKEYPNIGDSLVYNKFHITHEAFENGATIFIKALEKTIWVSLKKALEENIERVRRKAGGDYYKVPQLR